MSRNTAREAVNKRLGKKRDVPEVFNGFLGNYENIVSVPGKVNYVYVTMADGMVTQAYNVIAPAILKLPVVCGYDQNQGTSKLLQVLSIRNLPRNEQNTPSTTVPNHHKTHEWYRGTDIAYIQLRQFMPLRPMPVDPMSIYIASGMVHVGGVWRDAGNQTVSLAEYVPSTGGAYPRPSGSAVKGKFVLISIDKTSGSAVVTSGSEIGAYSIGLSDIPATPVGNLPVCAVVLYYFQEQIIEAFSRSDLIDLRWGMFTDGTSHIVPTGITPVVDFYLTGYDNISGSFSSGSMVSGASGSGADGYLTSTDWNRFDKWSLPITSKGDMLYVKEIMEGGVVSGSVLSGSATAISVFEGNIADNVLDGNDETYWAGSSNPVDDDWIYIDLGSVKTIAGYKIYQPLDTNWSATRFKVQKSNSSSGSWVDIDDVTPAADTITKTLSEFHSCQYVRFYAVTGGIWSWHIHTIEIYEQNDSGLVPVLHTSSLPIGVEGTVLTSASGVPMWMAVTSGSGSTSGSHNGLAGLQGGSSGQYYHLTSAEEAIATQASGSGQAGYLSAADWNTFNAKSGSGVFAKAKAPISNFYLTGYDATSGSFASGSPIVAITDHTGLANIGTTTHADIDSALTRLLYTSGSNTGDQLMPITKPPAANFYLTGYDSASGSFTSGSVTSAASGSQVVPTNHPAVAGYAITGYSNVTGSMTSGSLVTDHVQLANIGSNTHAQVDTALTRLLYTSGSNTGNQIVPTAKAAVSNFALTGYDAVSGSFSSGSVIGNAGTLDGSHASATPTAATVPIADANGKLDGWVSSVSGLLIRNTNGGLTINASFCYVVSDDFEILDGESLTIEVNGVLEVL